MASGMGLLKTFVIRRLGSYSSIMSYMNSQAFAPKEPDKERLAAMFR